jgi:hypothetical protein
MKKLWRILALVVAAGVLSFGAALPAAAHGGDIILTITPDGEGGVTLTPVYEGDGHPVEDIIDPVLMATSDSGKKVGPVQLVSSAEGVGVWVTEGAVLEEGHWEVTVSITTPSESSATTEFDVVALDAPVEVETGMPGAENETDAPGLPPVLIAVIAAIVLAALAVILVLRRRATAPARAGGNGGR